MLSEIKHNVVSVSEKENQALNILYKGGDYGDILEEIDEGAEVIEKLDGKGFLEAEDYGLNTGLSEKAKEYLENSQSSEEDWSQAYEDLSAAEAKTLFGTLSGCKRATIAEKIDDAGPDKISYIRSDLVDKGYLRNLDPGPGRCEYITGRSLAEKWDDPQPEFPREIEIEAVEMLNSIKTNGYGFGIISENLDNPHEIAERLEEHEMIREDQSKASGLEVTDRGWNYLRNMESKDNSRTRESSGRSGRKKMRRSVHGKADEDLLNLGEEMLESHEEKIGQEENAGIDSRDLTDEESEDWEPRETTDTGADFMQNKNA